MKNIVKISDKVYGGNEKNKTEIFFHYEWNTEKVYSKLNNDELWKDKLQE